MTENSAAGSDAAGLRVVATIPIDPARTEEALPALRDLESATRQEPGCRSYELHASTTVPGTFLTIEEWDSQADLDGHMQQPHVARAFEVAGPLLAGEIAIHVLD